MIQGFSCNPHRFGQHSPVADVIGEQQDQAGVDLVALGFAQVVVHPDEFVVESIGIVKFWIEVQRHYEAHSVASGRVQGIPDHAKVKPFPAGSDVLIWTQQVSGADLGIVALSNESLRVKDTNLRNTGI